MFRTPLAIAAVAALLSACTDPCIALGEKLCECEGLEGASSYQVDSCKTTLSNEAARVEITEADQERCEQLLDGCSCEALDTPEGKQACGLARAPGL